MLISFCSFTFLKTKYSKIILGKKIKTEDQVT